MQCQPAKTHLVGKSEDVLGQGKLHGRLGRLTTRLKRVAPHFGGILAAHPRPLSLFGLRASLLACSIALLLKAASVLIVAEVLGRLPLHPSLLLK